MVTPIDYKRLEPKEFVHLCADVLEAEGFKEVRVLEGTGDWKEDIHADEIIYSQSGVYEVLHFMVQCKHYAKSGNSVKPEEANEIFPYLFSKNANRLLIITDTDLTTQAKQEIESFNANNPIKRVTYWTQREVDNRLLQHRWIIDKYFPNTLQYNRDGKQIIFNPYKLLESYRENDYGSFFGRDNDITILAEAVYRNRTVILFGESGVGKTSLLNAGLFPKLRQEGWLIVSTRCLNNPIENIQRATVAQIEVLNNNKIDCLKLPLSFEAFLQNMSSISNQLGLKILIAMDQAEELFTLCDENDRTTLSLGISNTLNSTINGITFLLCLRDDYIGDLRSWTRGKIALDKSFSWDGLHSIGRFTVEEARLAIEEPTKRLGISYDKSFIEQLLTDLLHVGNGFVYQPYLQIVCSTLFDEINTQNRLDGNFLITSENYETLNGTTGIIGSFFSEKLWIGFTENEKTLARKVTQSLTTSEGLRHQLSLTDLEIATGEKQSDIDAVLQRLIDKRLVHRIVIEGNTQPVFELIHDFLGKQIANRLSDEEKFVKEAEELLAESLRRWQKHDVTLSQHELSILTHYKDKLRFSPESMRLIFSSTSGDLLACEPWFEYFGKNGIKAFVDVHLKVRSPYMYNFDKIVQKWADEIINDLIDDFLADFSINDSDNTLLNCLNLFSDSKDKRILSNERILAVAKLILLTKSDKRLVAKAIDLLTASKRGLEILVELGDKAVEKTIGIIPLSGFSGWFLRYSEPKRNIFSIITRSNVPYAIELLQKRVWTNQDARETESLVYIMSILSKDIGEYRRILLTHWTAYARQSAAVVLGEIGSEDAINALIEGLSNPYTSVLKEILIALGRTGNSKALPALEKLTEDPLISESTLGYVHKTIRRIKKREKSG